MKLTTLLQRWLPRSPVDRSLRLRANNAALDHTRLGLVQFLGLSSESAGALAGSLLDAYPALTPGLPVARMAPPPSEPIPEPLAVAAELEKALLLGPCLLVLPFNAMAWHLAGRLLPALAAPAVIIESPAVLACLPGLPVSPADYDTCAVQDLIRRVKAEATGAAPPRLYLSFPELHMPSAGTGVMVDFLGQRCRFSLLEPLLCAHGLRTLATLAVDRSGSAVAPLPATLVTWGPPKTDVATSGQIMATTLTWLLGQLQSSALAWPGLTLSWLHWYRASEPCLAIERSNRLKQFEAFFAAWKASGSGLDDPTYRFAVSRLTALRASPLAGARSA